MEQSSKTERTPVIFLLKSLLFSYILTGALLVILAFLLYKLNLSEKIVSAAIIVIYVAATFFAGFMTGKKIRNRRFCWSFCGIAKYGYKCFFMDKRILLYCKYRSLVGGAFQG